MVVPEANWILAYHRHLPLITCQVLFSQSRIVFRDIIRPQEVLGLSRATLRTTNNHEQRRRVDHVLMVHQSLVEARVSRF